MAGLNFSDFIARFEKQRKTGKGWSVRCPSHEDKTASLSVSEGREGAILLKCFAGCTTEQIVGSLGLTIKDLFPERNGSNQQWRPAPRSNPATVQPRVASNKPKPPPQPEVRAEIECYYSYRDAFSVERYQAVRMRPKSFRQRHLLDGKWVWNMDGVERVLYNLPRVLTATTPVWIVEGEKDADNLGELGYVATCNVGGAGKWLDGYTESLAGKDVIICGDNDKPGQEHVTKIFESITGKVRSVRIIKVPSPHKDVSELIEALNNDVETQALLQKLVLEAVPFVDGIRLPLYTMSEIEPSYERLATETSTTCFSFSGLLPTVGRYVRPLIPGDVCLIVAATGVGKTCLLQNLSEHRGELRTLFFEMELPKESLFERAISLKHRLTGREVEQSYRNGGGVGSAALDQQFRNFIICPETGLTLTRIEQIILKSELKFGDKAQLVMVDYAQLFQGKGDRYDRMSDIAEGLKRLAVSTGTILIVASQVGRPPKKKDDDGSDHEVSLFDAKESGSWENSAGVVLGAWRDPENPALMHLRVLKATKGGAGTKAECNFDGARMRITERSQVSDEDIPAARAQHND